MKKLIQTFTFLLFAFGGFAQDSLSVTYIDSLNLYMIESLTFDDDNGRLLARNYQYVDSTFFANTLFDELVNLEGSVINAETQIKATNKEIKDKKKFYNQVTGLNYLQELENKVVATMQGDWKLKAGAIVYDDVFVNNKTLREPGASGKRMRINVLNPAKLELKLITNQTPFFEDVEMTFRNSNRWTGRLSDGTRIVLSR